MNQAVGLVEVTGLASAIDVSDTMVKVANVELLGVEKSKGFGWMTVKVSGDVGAVKAAVDAGKAKAITNNVYLSSLVIPRPANNLEKFFFEKSVEPERSDESNQHQQPTEKKEENISENITVVPPGEISVEEKKKKNPSRGSKKPLDKKKKK